MAYPLRQKWANDVGKLIFLYKHNPELYSGFSLDTESQFGFVQLTVELNRTSANIYSIDEVSAKIKALRKKLVDLEKTRKETGVQPEWKHYDALRFLIPYLQELKSPFIGRVKPNAKAETSKKDSDGYVDSFINCLKVDLKKIKSSKTQDRIMRKIRSVVDAELKKQ